MGGALIETCVLDKMALALVTHYSTVVPVKVVKVRVVFVCCFRSVGKTACVITPRRTLVMVGWGVCERER